MIKQKLTIFALLAVVAISIPIAIASTTFFGEDCTMYDPEQGVGKVCNDLNNLNDRLYIVEHDRYIVNIEFQVEGNVTMNIGAQGMYYLKDDMVTWSVNNSTGVFASGVETLTANAFNVVFLNPPSDAYNMTATWDGDTKMSGTINLP